MLVEITSNAKMNRFLKLHGILMRVGLVGGVIEWVGEHATECTSWWGNEM